MSYFTDLKQVIEDGLAGKNKGISLGMPRLDKYVSLRKKMFYMIMGSSGSGKSSLLYDSFILNPLEQLSKSYPGRKLKYKLFSMERSKSYIQAKWLTRRVFLDTGKLIELNTLLNWYGDTLTPDALSLIDTYEAYFDFLEENIEIYEGSRTPNDIFKIMRDYSEANGDEIYRGEHRVGYAPRDKDVDVIVAIDHLGLTRVSKEHPTKKQAIDNLVERVQFFRDYLGYSIIAVNQMNRDLSSPLYSKLDSFEPHLDNAKETGSTVEAADVVLSIFDPLRYNTNDKFYGDVSAFKCPDTGHKYFRNIKVLKSSYGVDDAAIGTVFMGSIGRFKELPKSKVVREDWTADRYISIFNNSYFLNQY